MSLQVIFLIFFLDDIIYLLALLHSC